MIDTDGMQHLELVVDVIDVQYNYYSLTVSQKAQTQAQHRQKTRDRRQEMGDRRCETREGRQETREGPLRSYLKNLVLIIYQVR